MYGITVNNHTQLNDFYVKSYHMIRKYSQTAMVVFNELYSKVTGDASLLTELYCTSSNSLTQLVYHCSISLKSLIVIPLCALLRSTLPSYHILKLDHCHGHKH